MPKPSAIRVIKAASHGHNKGRTTRTTATTRQQHNQAELEQRVEGKRYERFKALANKRVPKALQALRLIENLASHNYKYTPEQVDKILRALDDGIGKIKEAFSKPKREHSEHSFRVD